LALFLNQTPTAITAAGGDSDERVGTSFDT